MCDDVVHIGRPEFTVAELDQRSYHSSAGRVSGVGRTTNMDNLIDNLARILATPMPRRKALGLLGGAFAAAVVAVIGAQPLSAQCPARKYAARRRTKSAAALVSVALKLAPAAANAATRGSACARTAPARRRVVGRAVGPAGSVAIETWKAYARRRDERFHFLPAPYLRLPFVTPSSHMAATGRLNSVLFSSSSVSAGIVSALTVLRSGRRISDHPFELLALLFPAYVALQLVPLPLPLMSVFSANRVRDRRCREDGYERCRRGAAQHRSADDLGVPAPHHRMRDCLFDRSSDRPSARHGPLARAAPLLLIGALETVWALMQVGGPTAVSGSYYNRNHLAGLLEMLLPFAAMYGLAIL